MMTCPLCGGQNGLHFQSCAYTDVMPRVSAVPRALPATPSGQLPYMYSQKGFIPCACGYAPCRCPEGAGLDINNPHGTVWRAGSVGSMGGDVPDDFKVSGNQQAGDPSEPHRAMAQKPAHVDAYDMLEEMRGKTLTHRDKGGRYYIMFVAAPAGEIMRSVGKVVIYCDADCHKVYARELNDFVTIMQPILLSDN